MLRDGTFGALIVALSVWFALEAACLRPEPRVVAEPDFVVTIARAANDAAASDCASACGRLRELGCAEGDGFAGGDSCSAVCEHINGGEAFAHVDVDCITHAQSTDAVRGCHVACPLRPPPP